ncbi:hypothetical protein N9H56_01330 [Pseudomonadales bacterium]|nr:hypothetical protein [Pseudomonadales bacterium]
MKILIAEFSSHWKVLENTYKLLKKNLNKSEPTLFINEQSAQKHLISLLFKDAERANWKTHKYHSSTYFMHLLLIGHNYDIINVSTGPEDPHYSNLFNSIFLYLCSIIYKNKLVLTIKNTRPYLKSTRGIKSFFLHLSIQNIRVITFESETLKKVFHSETKIPMSRLCASYDRYVDFNQLVLSDQKNILGANGKYRIGLLGAVEEFRRDYREIILALQNVSLDIRNRIEFVTLGNSNGGSDNPVLIELKKLVDVDMTDGWISVDEFDSRGAGCHLLISPLKQEMEYGTYKGSGTFGDAIYLKKKVIIPSHVDPFYEFEEIAYYYTDIESLTELFGNLDNLVNVEIQDDFYNKFSSKAVFDSVKSAITKNGMVG